MFSVEFTIPQLRDVYVEDYEFQIDIYRNTRVKLVVESPNLDPDEIVQILKMYDSLPIILNGVMTFTVTPGFARIVDDTKLEIQFYGHIANLFKKHGYYTLNGSGLIDYTIVDDETGIAIGVSPIELANDVLKGTNFKLLYAPSILRGGNISPYNRIFIRGEWLNRAEWLYEIAKNCYYYNYEGPDIVENGKVYRPDFTTDIDTTRMSAEEGTDGKLNDQCNVICDDVGNIMIGVAGCEYLGNNNWRKIVTNITDFVLSPKDTTYNFITYDNAVVQGGELLDLKNDSKKRTYLAKPIKLEMFEVFKNTFNKETYAYEGLSNDKSWKLNTDGDNVSLQCDSFRSGDRNFVCYDFATVDGLICNMGETNTFQVDITDVSGTPNIPWPAQENDRLILAYDRRRAGLFFNQQWPYYEDDSEDSPRTKEQMEGYFVFLEHFTSPAERFYLAPVSTPTTLATTILAELLKTIPGNPATANDIVGVHYRWAMVLGDVEWSVIDSALAKVQEMAPGKFVFNHFFTEPEKDTHWYLHQFGENVVPFPTQDARKFMIFSPHDMDETKWGNYYCYAENVHEHLTMKIVVADYSAADQVQHFEGFDHSLYLCMYGNMNMYSPKEENYQYYQNSVEREEKKVILRERIDLSFNPGKYLETPHTLKVDVTPFYSGSGMLMGFTFRIAVWQTPDTSVIMTYERTVHASNYLEPFYPTGKVGLFTYNRAPNEVAGVDDMDNTDYPLKIRFDNYKISCMSETLYGNVDKPILMHRDKAINNNTQGTMVAQSLLETQNRDKEIKVLVDPLLFFEKGIIPGQWVIINYPFGIKSDDAGYRVQGINITPDEVEFCLNHSDIRFIDQVDGIKKLIDVLDSF